MSASKIALLIFLTTTPNKGGITMLDVHVISRGCPLQLELTVPSLDDYYDKQLVVGYIRIRGDRVSAYGVPELPAPFKSDHFDQAVKLFEGECHIPWYSVRPFDGIVCQDAMLSYCIRLVEVWYNKVYLNPQDEDDE